MTRSGPGLAQPGGALAGQLDLDRHSLGQGVDVLAIQAGAGLQVGCVGELDGAVGAVALAGLAAQLPLAQPATTGGDAWLQGQPDDADGLDVRELRNDEGPGADVQADQPQRLDRGRDPQVAQEPVALDQAAVLPAVQHVAQGRLGQLAFDAWRAGREPAEEDAEDVGAGGVLLAEPAQGDDVAVGDAGIGIPAGSPGAAAAWPAAARRRSHPGTVEVGTGPDAASPKEALCGQEETSEGWSGPGGVTARAGKC